MGLSSYNNYALAKEIALFPIPVLTGIGHSTNETVAEIVSYKNAITPTELADFLIQRFHDFSVPIKKGEEIIVERAKRMLLDEKLRFKNFVKYFRSVTNGKLLRCRIISRIIHMLFGLSEVLTSLSTWPSAKTVVILSEGLTSEQLFNAFPLNNVMENPRFNTLMGSSIVTFFFNASEFLFLSTQQVSRKCLYFFRNFFYFIFARGQQYGY